MMAHISYHTYPHAISPHYRAVSSAKQISHRIGPAPSFYESQVINVYLKSEPNFLVYSDPSWRHEGTAARGGGNGGAAPLARCGGATHFWIGGPHLRHDHERYGGAILPSSLLQDAHRSVSLSIKSKMLYKNVTYKWYYK